MFAQKKQQILSEISSTDESSPDASPKGTIDEAIIPLIDIINQSADFVTTSSCSGRVSVFLEGVKSPSKIGGKGLGGKWLYVTHDKRELRENNCNWWQDQVKNHKEKEEEVGIEVTDDTTRYVIYKFEPMVCVNIIVCIRRNLLTGIARFYMLNVGPMKPRVGYIQLQWDVGFGRQGLALMIWSQFESQ